MYIISELKIQSQFPTELILLLADIFEQQPDITNGNRFLVENISLTIERMIPVAQMAPIFITFKMSSDEFDDFVARINFISYRHSNFSTIFPQRISSESELRLTDIDHHVWIFQRPL